MPQLLKDLKDDLFSPTLLPALSIGLVLGTMIVVLEISFAAMIFSGELAIRSRSTSFWKADSSGGAPC